MWELAGTAHADVYLLAQSAADAANSGLTGNIDCGNPPINNGPQTFGIRAAMRALPLWTQSPLLKPAIAPHLSVQIVTSPTPPAVINHDPATGNAIGGIRLPQVAVPIAMFSGDRPPAAFQANPFCVLFGATDPWDSNIDAMA